MRAKLSSNCNQWVLFTNALAILIRRCSLGATGFPWMGGVFPGSYFIRYPYHQIVQLSIYFCVVLGNQDERN
ncbi:MAG TPA: hypothetical protein DCE41_27710 [Cytophagales bacterium]|nr:hypothetical protein [Cytophagales bacterium]